MSLEHRLLLISIPDRSLLNKLEFYTSIMDGVLDEKCSILLDVTIQDSIVAYFIDYLSWIPAKNYYDDSIIYGLNRCGITIYDAESKQKLSSVLNAIQVLFANAPDTIALHGEASISDNGVIRNENIEISKVSFLDTLRKIVNAIDVIGSDNSFLIHLGV